MAGIIDRLPNLVELRYENLPILQNNASDQEKDKNGSASSSLAGSLRFLGVANYILNHDISMFKEYLSEAAAIRKQLFERFEGGEPISESYVAMLSYKALMNALAAGDFELSKELASMMGGRDEIEKEHDHPFDYALGYTLKSFVLNDYHGMQQWAKNFEAVCTEKENVDFLGYAQLFIAILNKDENKANQGISEIIKGHKKQSKGYGVFKDSEDETLCVWGIGMVNLARYRNLNVQGSPPLVPDDLLFQP